MLLAGSWVPVLPSLPMRSRVWVEARRHIQIHNTVTWAIWFQLSCYCNMKLRVNFLV